MYKVLAVQPAPMNARGREGKCNGLRTETSTSSIPKVSVLVDNGRSIISSAQQFLSRKRPDETKAAMNSKLCNLWEIFPPVLDLEGIKLQTSGAPEPQRDASLHLTGK